MSHAPPAERVSPAAISCPICEGLLWSGPHSGRLKSLLAVHLVVGAGLAWFVMLQPNIPGPVLPAIVAVYGGLVGQFVLLALWAGFGVPIHERCVLLVAIGSIYFAAIVTLGFAQPMTPRPNRAGEVLVVFIVTWEVCCILTGLLTAALQAVRSKFAHVRHVRDLGQIPPQASSQWTLSQLLVLMGGMAVFMAAARYAGVQSAGAFWLVVGLWFAGLLSGAVSLVWAALSPGRIAWRIALTLTLLVFLTVAVATTIEAPGPDPSSLLAGALVITSPVYLILPSLLVVRSCGYRLVSKKALASLAARSPDDRSTEAQSL